MPYHIIPHIYSCERELCSKCSEILHLQLIVNRKSQCNLCMTKLHEDKAKCVQLWWKIESDQVMATCIDLPTNHHTMKFTPGWHFCIS